MTIRLLGTGAADGIPSFYSDSNVSKYARLHGGKDVRTRSSAIVDGHLKIDLGPDSLQQINRDKLSALDWTALLITHSHEDHLAVSELQYCLYPFNGNECAGYSIFGNATVVAKIWERYPDWPFEVFITRSFESFRHAEYKITPIRANHITEEDGQNFLIENGVTLLYATDTGIWDEETFDFLKDFKLDALVLECTEGFLPTAFEGHLDIESCKLVVDRLRAQGTLQNQSRVVTTHHSHSGDATHAQLEECLLPSGIEPGFDGFEFTV